MTEPFTTAVQAAAYLRDCCSNDPELRYSLALIAHNHGFKDFLEWAAENPERAIDIAEAQRDIVAQDELLSKGMQSA